MNDVPSMLLGAALVAIGILAAALADRVRGLSIPREREPNAADWNDASNRGRRSGLSADPEVGARTARAQSKGQHQADDVIAALVASGHKKQVATEVVWGCSAAERATIEDWTRAALRRCARGWTS